jgi:hypothetical protein
MIPTNLGDSLQVRNLLPVADVTSSSDSAALDLFDLEGQIAIALDAKNVAGTLPTLACKIQHCDTSGGSYVDATGGAFAGITTVASLQKIVLNKNDLKRFIKLHYVIGGSASPEYYVSSKVMGMKKYDL